MAIFGTILRVDASSVLLFTDVIYAFLEQKLPELLENLKLDLKTWQKYDFNTMERLHIITEFGIF